MHALKVDEPPKLCSSSDLLQTHVVEVIHKNISVSGSCWTFIILNLSQRLAVNIYV